MLLQIYNANKSEDTLYRFIPHKYWVSLVLSPNYTYVGKLVCHNSRKIRANTMPAWKRVMRIVSLFYIQQSEIQRQKLEILHTLANGEHFHNAIRMFYILVACTPTVLHCFKMSWITGSSSKLCIRCWIVHKCQMRHAKKANTRYLIFYLNLTLTTAIAF